MTIKSELVRPFLPTKDIEASRRFYEALGFEMTLDGEVVIFRAGSGGFILQRHFHDDWAGNCMMQLMVDDLDAWWSHIETLDLPNRFGVSPPKPPAMQPWGLRIVYVVDPAGVLWHIAQRRAGVTHDNDMLNDDNNMSERPSSRSQRVRSVLQRIVQCGQCVLHCTAIGRVIALVVFLAAEVLYGYVPLENYMSCFFAWGFTPMLGVQMPESCGSRVCGS